MKHIYTGKNTVIEGNVTFGDQCSIWHNAVIRGDNDTIAIGNNTNIQDLVMIHTGFNNCPVHVGNDVTIGHSAIVHGCTIGNNCLIGMGSIIMNKAVIGNNCIVAAGALVTERKHFEDGTLIMGSPAKAIRSLTQEEIDNIQKNAQLYVQEAKAELEEKSI